MSNRDDFARSSASRAWKAANEAGQRVDEILVMLDRIEKRSIPHLQRCGWCGVWCIGPACRSHFDLLTTADLLEEELGA